MKIHSTARRLSAKKILSAARGAAGREEGRGRGTIAAERAALFTFALPPRFLIPCVAHGARAAGFVAECTFLPLNNLICVIPEASTTNCLRHRNGALGVHGGVSTTLTYFVVQLSAAVVLLRPSPFSSSPSLPPVLFSPSRSSRSHSTRPATLYHQGSVVLDEIAIVIAIILFLLLLLCTSIRDIRTWC